MEQNKQKKNKTLAWVVAVLIVVLAAIFAIQNNVVTEINFLFLKVEGPLFLVIVIVFLLGLFLGRILHLLHRKKKPKKEDIT